jgi:hypothetical protein
MANYDLEFINGVDMKSIYNNIPFDEETLNKINSLKLTDKLWKYNDDIYRIIRYDKNFLTNDMINSIGLFRSVIVDYNNKIVSFSPPKSHPYETFKNNHPNLNDVTLEEYVEGTMINLFWDKEWNISTKSTVGGKIIFFQDENNLLTFRTMFIETCNAVNLDFNNLSKVYCYTKKIFLVKVYKIDNYKVQDIDKEYIYKEYFKDTNVELPTKHNSFSSYLEMENNTLNMNNSYDNVGIMLHAKNGDRTKLRNPTYEYVRKLRGNQPKLQYEYLSLRKTGKLKEFLKYYPEYKKNFNEFRDQLHKYTTSLYVNYVNCYIKKTKPLLEYPPEFRTNMFNLHQQYINSLRDEKKHVNFNVAREYVNNLHPAQQMHFLNYNVKKQYLDGLNADDKLKEDS